MTLVSKDYIFDVWTSNRDSEEKVLRRIKIGNGQSLYNFAKAITKAFGFYFDHCFGFYDNIERYCNSKASFELFADIGEEPLSPTTKSVKKTKIGQVFQAVGDRILFLFDYGDDWHFIVELKEIEPAMGKGRKAEVLESIGEAPEQYSR